MRFLIVPYAFSEVIGIEFVVIVELTIFFRSTALAKITFTTGNVNGTGTGIRWLTQYHLLVQNQGRASYIFDALASIQQCFLQRPQTL